MTPVFSHRSVGKGADTTHRSTGADARPPKGSATPVPQGPSDIGVQPSGRLHRKKAAVHIGMSLSWLDKSRLKGDGPAYLQIGGRIVYDTADLDCFMAECRRRSTSQGTMKRDAQPT